ncbi:MAG: hypothetical protein WCP45_07330 [Verrucomicrobiota bacterium]
MGAWADVGGSFAQQSDASGTKLTGQPLDPTESSRFYRLNMSLDPGPLTASSIATMTGATQYGMSGNGNWTTDQATGNLVSNGGNTGDTNRMIANVSGPVTLNFEMEVVGGDWNDGFAFYVDGVKQSETYGDPVNVQVALPNPGTHLLMWEFTRGSGKAVIHNLAQ